MTGVAFAAIAFAGAFLTITLTFYIYSRRTFR